MFIDLAEIYLKAGNGGPGKVSFLRAKYVPNGGPDGGDGGDGGSIVFEVDLGLRTLVDFRYRRKYIAEPGGKGDQKNMSGRNAKDLVVKVPRGTIVRDKETNMILADMSAGGQRQTIARGGKGGWGNQHFATPTRQIPNFAHPGTQGVERSVILELKTLADVGLVGFPNAGKSTLISSVSAAKPKIASYPFTTLTPVLGIVSVGPGESFAMADIPGLIEGAHEGVGLGHAFLRHVERTRLLLHVVDAAETEGRDAFEDFTVINRELSLYSDTLAKRPQIVVANKSDAVTDAERLERFVKAVRDEGYEVFVISAATGDGVPELMRRTADMLGTLPEITVYEAATPEALLAAHIAESPYTIRNDNGTYVVEGPWVERILGSVNFADRESLQYFQRVMKTGGVIGALEKKGVREGDTVRVGDTEFNFIP
jgi:GTP-binding protein